MINYNRCTRHTMLIKIMIMMMRIKIIIIVIIVLCEARVGNAMNTTVDELASQQQLSMFRHCKSSLDKYSLEDDVVNL